MTSQYNVVVNTNASSPMKTGYTFVQGDKGISFRILVNELDFASPITAKIVFHRANGTSVESAASYTGNVVSYTTLGNEFAVPGLVVADVKFYDGDTQRVSTASFLFNVTEDTLDGLGGGTAGYSDELEVLRGQLEEEAALFAQTLQDYIDAFGDVGALHPAGDWDNVSDYNVLDLVWHNGASWLAKLANTNQEPQIGSAYWQMFVQSAGSSADQISYDNTVSGLTADDVQEAIDELASEKQDKNLSSPITVDGVSKSTVETALSALNTYADKIDGNVDAVVNVYGSKNLLENQLTTEVQNAVTATVNADGTVSLSGISTNSCYFILRLNNLSLKKGTYKMTGCPQGGNSNTYSMYAGQSGVLNTVFDTGDGVEFTLSTDANAIEVVIRIFNIGQDCTGLVFKPMLRDARITDDTYVPYAMTNRELTENLAKKGNMSYVGVKNLTKTSDGTKMYKEVMKSLFDDFKAYLATKGSTYRFALNFFEIDGLGYGLPRTSQLFDKTYSVATVFNCLSIAGSTPTLEVARFEWADATNSNRVRYIYTSAQDLADTTMPSGIYARIGIVEYDVQ